MNTNLFETETFSPENQAGHYRIFLPKGNGSATYPLIAILPEANCPGDLESSCITWFCSEKFQKVHPCFVLLPELPSCADWNSSISDHYMSGLIRHINSKYPVDSNRIYLHGIGGGATAVFHLMTKFPFLIAAVLTVNGFGNPYNMAPARNIPVWAFHTSNNDGSGKQNVCNGKQCLVDSLRLVNALRFAGNTSAKYTEVPLENEVFNKELLGMFDKVDAADWLFSQTRTLQYDITLIMPGVYMIDDFSDATAYLIEGRDKALLIDTGMGGGCLRKVVESLTPLPVELAITHAHGDHFLHASEFEKVYMHPRDITIMPQMQAMFSKLMVGHEIDFKKLIPISEGDVIELGGGVDITVLELAGHTPGSVAFVDQKHGVIAMGDAIGSGSGVWMQVQSAIPIKEYRQSLLHFSEKLQAYHSLLFLGGHRMQNGSVRESPLSMMGKPFYNPLTKQTVTDMAELCRLLLEKKIKGEPYPISQNGKTALIATYHTASLVYFESQIE